MSRVFLSMTDDEVCALDAAREKVGMTKSHQYQGIETAECLSYPVDLPLGHAGVCIHPAVEDRNVQLPVRSVESMDDQTGNGTGEMAWK